MSHAAPISNAGSKSEPRLSHIDRGKIDASAVEKSIKPFDGAQRVEPETPSQHRARFQIAGNRHDAVGVARQASQQSNSRRFS